MDSGYTHIEINKQCYNLKLELRLHLGKNLRKSKGWIQVVKHNNTGMYLHYIYVITMSSPWGKRVIKHEETQRKKWGCSTYYMRCWLRLLQCSCLCHHTLNPTPCYILEVLIVTIPCFQLLCPYKIRPIPPIFQPHILPSFSY